MLSHPAPTDWLGFAGFTLVVLVALAIWCCHSMWTDKLREVRRQARLAERERIARELHDTVLQGSIGLVLQFDAIARQLPESHPLRPAIETSLERADRAISEARDRVLDLRSHQFAVDLPSALKGVVRELDHDPGRLVQVNSHGPADRLDDIVTLEAFRICKEALTNAMIHSGADRVTVDIWHGPAAVTIRIEDNGAGMPSARVPHGGDAEAEGSAPRHWGLLGMKERAAALGARLHISSSAGAGTVVELVIDGRTAYGRRRAAPEYLPLQQPHGA